MTISNHDDLVDSRDILRRIAELEGERDVFAVPCTACDETGRVVDVNQMTGGDENPNDAHVTCAVCGGDQTILDPLEWALCNTADAVELNELLDVEEQVDDREWVHGIMVLVRDAYFEDYARDMASDLGLLKDVTSWPYTCIDWERAASELQQDYTSIEWDGVTYWVRG